MNSAVGSCDLCEPAGGVEGGMGERGWFQFAFSICTT